MPGKNIVAIGGGTGVYTVLTGLKKYPLNLTAIVSMADDGGSTGVLREEFGILPPGDIRRALMALSHHPGEFLADLFNYRFKEGEGLKGHNFGNLLITAFERLTGDFEKAIEEAGKILNVRGTVIPVTLDHTRLHAELEDGTIIRGETNIDVPKHNPELRIKQVFLDPKARVNTRATEAIGSADIIVIGPGDLYTSIIPNVLVDGVGEAIIGSRAHRVYICNVMTKYGETNGFRAIDFLQELERYFNTKEPVITHFVVNSERPSEAVLERYKNSREKSEFVAFPECGVREHPAKVIAHPLIRRGTLIRHDPNKLADVLVNL